MRMKDIKGLAPKSQRHPDNDAATLNKSDRWACPKGLEEKAYESILSIDL